MPQKRTFLNRFGAGHQQNDLTPVSSLAPLSAVSAFACAAFLFLGTALGFAQTTVHVPADKTTIQAGIDAASNGDTVLVAPGTYNENIDFKGKAITVLASGSSTATIIDGGNRDGMAVVTFKSHESRTSVLSGFTIQHGGSQTATSVASGGVYISAAAPVVLSNIIAANHCSGIFANGAALLASNVVSGTLYQNPGQDANCQQGGTGVVVEGTTSVGSYTHVELLGNTIVGNRQAVQIGGLAVLGAEGTLVQSNIIVGNTGSYVGGIEAGQVNSVVISNNLIYSNSAGQGNTPGYAGGLHLTAPSATVSGNTFGGNSLASGLAGESGTEIDLAVSVTHVNLANNIIVGYSSTFPVLNCSASNAGGTPAFDHNDIYNGGGGKAYGGACSDQSGLTGNISADPLFVSPGSVFHVNASSPTIDSGDNGAYLMPAIDLEANARIQDATSKGHPIVDMGVYEYPGALDGSGYNVVLTSSLNPAAFGQQVTFTAYITSAPSVGNPAGSVTFADGSTVLATQTLQSGGTFSGFATFATSSLAAGSHTITATFNPTSGTPSASAPLIESVTGAGSSTTVTSSLNPSTTGQSVTFTATVNSNSGNGGAPTGTLRFLDGSALLATQTLAASGSTSATASYSTSTLSVGSHTITATYDGNAGLGTSSGTVAQTVLGTSGTTTTISGSPNPAFLGKNVHFVVTVSGGNSALGAPTGTVTLTLGGTTLGSQTVTPSGAATSQATFDIGTLPLGAQTIQASYTPSGNFSSSAASVIENIITAADFTLTPGQINLSIQTQHHATATLTLTSLSSFQDSVSLSCGALPVYVTCRLTPATAALTPGSTATVSLYVDTDSVIGYASLHQPEVPGPLRHFPPVTGLAIAAPMCLAAMRRRFRGAAKAARLLLLLLVSCATLVGLSGCGSIILPLNIPPSAKPGIYTIPITATGATSGISHTSVLTLTITP